ncbi:molybdopterin-dependent oxidoreductase [Priestia koreensis]|uniref:Oxidoreductase n=1 Tax=Priestia koreensis TaxID=284581 RepID=A0A0M0L4F3_9BACI|nr:molybdopterin-dependent oxidoreductase [Priestia koreensis]KOO45929.1 oxidoreductase [Priestia koreensis]
MKKEVISSCPLNCWDSCGFHVTVENNKVIKVDGDANHPITQGKICGRGRALETRANSSDRLLHPLKKINGQFVQISWEQALAEIAEKMADIKKKYGSQAVLHSHDYANNGLLKNLDQRFFNSYGGVTELTGSICWGAGIEAQVWDFGDSYSHSPHDIYHSKHVVIWGRNVARTNMHLFQHLQEAKKHGIHLTVIDPIYNATAKIAHDYISIKPGMDGILAIGIIKELRRLGLENHHFIEQYSIGYEDLVALVDEISMEEIVNMTEIPHDRITGLAELYAERPVTTYLGLGMQRYKNGGNTIRLIDALIAVSGNIGIQGGGANFGNLQVGQSFNSNALTLPERKQKKRSFTMMKQAEGILEAVDPEIQMIMVTCGNPVTQVPNTNLVEKAFSSVNTLVVIDQFMTDTAALADYVLPTTTVFEETDIYYASMYHGYMNYGEAAVTPPGEAKSDRWIWTELAKRLGFGEVFDYTVDEFLEMGLSKLKDHGITLDRLKEEKHLLLPIKDVPWSTYEFKTPSGKYEFTSTLGEKKGYNGKLQLLFPEESSASNMELARKFPYQLLSIHPMRSNHSQHYPVIKGLQEVKIEVSQDVATDVGLEEGDTAQLFNDRGTLKGKVKIMKIAHPGTINVDEGQWKRFGGSVNLLTPNGESDNGLGSTLYDCLVGIKKVESVSVNN